jgi:Galactose oxidase, central domain
MIRILWTQKQDAGPGLRRFTAMAYDSRRGRTVLFGGTNSTGPLSDTWEWDGANWTQMADSGPPPRSAHAMAYDAQRNQTVLFSGQGFEGSPADTWGWDGSNWTQLADNGIFPRGNSAMAYDSNRQRTVLFGGTALISGKSAGASQNPESVGGDTWEWDGVAWTQQAETGPAQRLGHVMAYDSGRDRTVLFGGLGASVLLGDTWEWNGSVWTQMSDFGPAPSLYAALAFKGDSVALFGGAMTDIFPQKPFGSTWTWDGKNWTLRQDFGPPPRCGHAMSYDGKRATLVLFGGASDPNSYFADTWEHSEGP